MIIIVVVVVVVIKVMLVGENDCSSGDIDVEDNCGGCGYGSCGGCVCGGGSGVCGHVMLRIEMIVVVVAVVEEFPRRIDQRQNVIRLSCDQSEKKINELTNAITIL